MIGTRMKISKIYPTNENIDNVIDRMHNLLILSTLFLFIFSWCVFIIFNSFYAPQHFLYFLTNPHESQIFQVISLTDLQF